MYTREWVAKNIGVICGLLSPEECANFIAEAHSHQLPLLDAPSFGWRHVSALQHAELDDRQQALMLSQRIAPFLPLGVRLSKQRKFHFAGLCRIRVYRCDTGQPVAARSDIPDDRGRELRCFWSLAIYLNDTVGDDDRFSQFYGLPPISIRPQQGKGVVIKNDVSNRAGKLAFGHKYVLRADVMFRRTKA